MPEVSKEIIALISFLTPGFLAAWVIYGLTSHDKPAQFERVIQALILTVAIKALVFLESKIAIKIGQYWHLGTWNEDSALICSMVTALLVGLGFSYLVNKDLLHNFLRRCKFTNRSSHPNEWSDVLSKFPRYVVLHLEGERRLFGWPEVWPSNPKSGHFFIITAAWLQDGEYFDITGAEGVLIQASDVHWIEFMSETETPK